MQTISTREQLIQAEAVYSFVASITTGSEVLIASGNHDSSVWACKIQNFLSGRGNNADPYPVPQETYKSRIDNTFYKYGNTPTERSLFEESKTQAVADPDEASTMSTLVFEGMVDDLTTEQKTSVNVVRSGAIPSIREGMAVISQHMTIDPGYAWSWHCNLAMMIRDCGVNAKDANMATAQFMKQAFEVDTTNHPTYLLHTK